MISEVHFGVVRLEGQWTIIGQNLKTRTFETREAAEDAARRFADVIIGRSVTIHSQGSDGELKRTLTTS